MGKQIIRKHSAKCLSYVLPDGSRKHYALIGGCWSYCGNSGILVSESARLPNGIWRDSIARVLATSSHRCTKDLVQQIKFEGGKQIKIAIHEWTSIDCYHYSKDKEGTPF